MDEQLKQIFMDVFGLGPEQYRPDLSMESLEAWDSVTHLTLLLTLEQKFGVAFEPDEGSQLNSIPAIRDALTRKAAAS